MTNNKVDQILAEQETLAEKWGRIAELFRTRNALKTRRMWFTGMSARVGN